MEENKLKKFTMKVNSKLKPVALATMMLGAVACDPLNGISEPNSNKKPGVELEDTENKNPEEEVKNPEETKDPEEEIKQPQEVINHEVYFDYDRLKTTVPEVEDHKVPISDMQYILLEDGVTTFDPEWKERRRQYDLGVPLEKFEYKTTSVQSMEHEGDYYAIDGVPVSKAKYERIANEIKERIKFIVSVDAHYMEDFDENGILGWEFINCGYRDNLNDGSYKLYQGGQVTYGAIKDIGGKLLADSSKELGKLVYDSSFEQKQDVMIDNDKEL